MKPLDYEELTPVFERAAVDLPPALRARLQAIPTLAPPISLGWVVAALVGPILGLGVAWRYREVGLNLWDRGTILLERLVTGSWDFLVELANNASLPEPELAVINGLMMAVVILIGLGLGLYLWAESRGLRLYAQQLTGRA